MAKLVLEPDVRLAAINAILRDVATKGGLEGLKESSKRDMESLEGAMGEEMRALRAELLGRIGRVGVVDKKARGFR